MQRDRFFPPRIRYFSNKAPEQRKHLIIFLSYLPDYLKTIEGVPEGLSISGDLNKDIDTLEELKKQKYPNWPWEMPLRALRHHTDPDKIGPLKTVTVICSKESIEQSHLFYNICRNYARLEGVVFQILCFKNQKIHLEPLRDINTASFQGFDFENFDELSKAILNLLHKFDKMGVRARDIMVDITGGQKPTSIVGAAMTFNQEINAQYVQTNHPWNIKSYDVIHVSHSTGKLTI